MNRELDHVTFVEPQPDVALKRRPLGRIPELPPLRSRLRRQEDKSMEGKEGGRRGRSPLLARCPSAATFSEARAPL